MSAFEKSVDARNYLKLIQIVHAIACTNIQPH